MSNIADIDKNFKIETKIDKEDIVFYDATKKPFKVYGAYYEDGCFRRMPESVAKATSDGVYQLSIFPAGARLKVKTDSAYFAIKVILENVSMTAHGSVLGASGFDLYEKRNGEELYVYSLIPPVGGSIDTMKDGYESVVSFSENRMRELTLNFPRYCTIKALYIGLSENAVVLPPEPHKYEKPIVYYGSSITQGGCASRPGNAYQNIISRRLDCNYINLGFSGNAKGEPAIYNYIKDLDMSIFVYDYDHNAPTIEHLKNTHEPMFKAIRSAQPNLPIVIMSRPQFILSDAEEQRLEIIRTTYQNAVDSGDKNVYLLTGPELMKYAGKDGTVDNCHPNDFGFHSMAKVLGDVLEKLLIEEK